MVSSIESVKAHKGYVTLRTREWDGIDRAEFSSYELSPDQADGWAEDLKRAAETAREQQYERDRANYEKLVADRDALLTALAKSEALLAAHDARRAAESKSPTPDAPAPNDPDVTMAV